MLVSVLNSVYFSRNFKTSGLFCSPSILLHRYQFFFQDYFDLYENKFKMADSCRSLVNNTWRHHDITAIANYFLCVN